MAPYIALALIVVGMFGVAMPLALHWDKQQKKRQNRDGH